MIPAVAECFQLMDLYEMLPNIREHSVMVGRVAGLIAKGAIEAGLPLSLELTVSGALLHDIAKTPTLNSDLRHDEVGRQICLRHGFDELADIVAEHVVLKNGVESGCCTEKEIVYYADKRVLHHEIVALGARLEYIIERYGNGDELMGERIRRNFQHAHQIEEQLFSSLHFAPHEVVDLVNGHALDLGGFRL
ncbi:MAG: HDIG domain-containing protein [Desulfobulbaceae bacterium]|nr:HDIG domain-containing protein [Desulfobulbaceae bacterium]HIJ78273.1 HDIG domain-containing protein [Deltaproteobacteria bacterium]